MGIEGRVNHKKFEKDIKKFFPSIQYNISLKRYNTFQIEAKAKYFLVAKTKKSLINILRFAGRSAAPFFVLSGGSNVLMPDRDIDGLVIKIENAGIKFQKAGSKTKIICEAGVNLAALLRQAIKKKLAGLEWAAGMPGTVGGAIRGNAGAFGLSISDIIERVEVLDLNSFEIGEFKKRDCQFKYRDSIFKRHKNLEILSCRMQIGKGDSREIGRKVKEYLKIRGQGQPLNFPSAGSVFVNYEFQGNRDKSLTRKLLKEFPRIEEFVKKGIIPAGFLIESCGLKGKRIGGAQISKKHANFIINLGGAKAKDVLGLIKLVKKTVAKNFGIKLKEEINVFSSQ